MYINLKVFVGDVTKTNNCYNALFFWVNSLVNQPVLKIFYTPSMKNLKWLLSIMCVVIGLSAFIVTKKSSAPIKLADTSGFKIDTLAHEIASLVRKKVG